jgi:folate-binding protein YgfZ
MPLCYAALGDRVCVDVRGADAAAFLHAQLSRAVRSLDPSDAPLAGWADARGRVRALFRVLRTPDRWLLVTARDGADAVVKKLRMFVLRADVAVTLAEDIAVAALLGDGSELAALGAGSDTPPNRLARAADLCFIRVGAGYWQAVGSRAALAPLAAALPPTTEAATALAEIELGIPEIGAATADRFVAQMLNLDALGAVSFDKGCYPGQEIIARVHNLGGVKRRARRYAVQSAPPPCGAEVLADGARAVGEVIRAAPAASGAELLAVVDHAAADARLTCGGAPLAERALPFAVPRD